MGANYSSWEWGKSFAVAGIALASSFFVFEKVVGVTYPYLIGRVERFLWPFSIFVPASHETGDTAGMYLVMLLAILLNGAPYFVAGVFLSQLKSLASGADA